MSLGSRISYSFLFCFACTLLSWPQDETPKVLDLHAALGGDYVCPVAQSIQFLTEEELVVLASPTSRCYDAVGQIEMIAVSLDGRVLARRGWSSTEPGLVLRPERLVLPVGDSVEVLDKDLRTVQTLRNPKRRRVSHIGATDIGMLSVATNGGTDFYAGTPLRRVDPRDSRQILGGTEVVSTLDGSWELARVGNELVQRRAGGHPRVLADLEWIAPSCELRDVCQADESTIHFQTVLGRKSRILITANGTTLPITTTFGLVPYFRVQVFDLELGAEVYREQDVLRARERSAALSPDGDFLVVNDGVTATIHGLQ